MVEPIAFVSAFAGLAVPGRRQGGGGLLVAEHCGFGLAGVVLAQGAGARFEAAARRHVGIAPADGPKVSRAGEVVFIGTGPGQWLAMKPSGGWRFAEELRVALGDTAAVSDHSSGYGVLRLSGPHVRAVLASGVPIDLDPVAFGAGDAAVTVAGHVGVVLWQADAEADGEAGYDIAVSRSFAGSFWHWLEAGAAAVGIAVGPPVAGAGEV